MEDALEPELDRDVASEIPNDENVAVKSVSSDPVVEKRSALLLFGIPASASSAADSWARIWRVARVSSSDRVS